MSDDSDDEHDVEAFIVLLDKCRAQVKANPHSVTDKLHGQLARIYLRLCGDDDDESITAADYVDYVRKYMRAAELLPATDAELLFPRCQLLGHALELALKAFIAARGSVVPRTSRIEQTPLQG